MTTPQNEPDRLEARGYPASAAVLRTVALRREIDGAVLENDLDKLADLLVKHERDDDARCVIYEAIDVVAANLDAERTDR